MSEDKSKDTSVDDKKVDDSKDKTVSAAEYEKVRGELKTLRNASKDTETKLADALKKIEESTSNSEKEKGNYKSLYESEKQKNQDWEKKHTKLKETVVHNEKFKAVQSKLLESGLRKDAVSILEKETLDEVLVEHTSEGRMLVNGVDEFVDGFKKKYSFAFEQKKSPTVNGGGGSGGGDGGGSGEMNADKLHQIERKHGRSSEEFKKAYASYLEQRAKRK